jgi:hypothetical protein
MRVVAEITLGSGTVWEVEYKDCKTTRPRNAVTLAIEKYLSEVTPISLALWGILARLGKVLVLDADEKFMWGSHDEEE